MKPDPTDSFDPAPAADPGAHGAHVHGSSRRPWPLALLAGFGCIVAFVLVQGVGFSIVEAAGGRIKTDGVLGLETALSFAGVQAIGIVAIAALVLFTGVTSWRRLGLLASREAVRDAMRVITPVGLLVIVPTFAYALVSGDALIAPRIDWQLGGVLVLLAVLIAVNEELWFRGVVFQALGSPGASAWFVVLASAVLFGAPHATNEPASWLNAGAVTLAVGIPFAAVRIVCQSLLPLIVWHAIIDAWAFLHTASVIPTGDPTPAEIVSGLFLPSLIALAYLGWMRVRLQRERVSR